MLQCVAVCCSVLQSRCNEGEYEIGVAVCRVCCSMCMLQYLAVCCRAEVVRMCIRSGRQCVVLCSEMQCFSGLQR